MGSEPNTFTKHSACVRAALLSYTVWQVSVTTHQSIRCHQSLLFHPIHSALNVRFINTLCAGSLPHPRACPLWPCLHFHKVWLFGVCVCVFLFCVCVCVRFFFTLVVSWAVVHSVRIVKYYGLQPEVHQGVQPVVCRLYIGLWITMSVAQYEIVNMFKTLFVCLFLHMRLYSFPVWTV